MKIIAAIPAYNEEATIGSVVLRARKYVDTVIVVDDGSTDDTGLIAGLAGAEVVKHERNKGKGAALKSGFKKAKEFNPDVVVCLDADAQHNPDEIPVLIDVLINEGADIVVGSRFLNHQVRDLPFYRRFGQRILDLFTNLIGESKISDTQSGFRAFSGKALEKLEFKQTGLDIESGILIEAKEYHLKIKEAPISVRYDIAEPSQHPVSHGISVIYTLINFMSIKHPLLVFGVSGAVAIVVGLILGWITMNYFNTHRMLPIGTALLTVLLIIAGMVLSSMAIILYSMIGIIKKIK